LRADRPEFEKHHPMEEDKYVVLAGNDVSPDAVNEVPHTSMYGDLQALWARTNHNVKFILVIVVFAGLSESLTFGSALASYLYMATGQHSTTGLLYSFNTRNIERNSINSALFLSILNTDSRACAQAIRM